MSPVRDISRDRLTDLIIGDPVNGKVYVLFGNTRGLVNMRVGFTLSSTTRNDYFGWSVSSAGDFNNDGFGDLLISALSSGRCYVVFGKLTGFQDMKLSSVPSDPAAYMVLNPSSTTVNTGFMVSPAGDFNGDGMDDILIASKATSTVNIVYIIFGGNVNKDGVLSLGQLSSTQGVVISSSAFSFIGVSLSSLGDVNGDGIGDIAIGSLPFQGGFTTQVCYVVYGRRNATNLNLQSMNVSEGFKITGGGIVVSNPGDVDGDGLSDLMVTNYGGWQGRSGSLIAYYPITASRHPTLFPTSQPSIAISAPSGRPSSSPTTHMPSNVPTQMQIPQTDYPTLQNGTYLTRSPSVIPTVRPTKAPFVQSSRPTRTPPTRSPSITPSLIPTKSPSFSPSFVPTRAPSRRATRTPTAHPTYNIQPTSTPSQAPTVSLGAPYDILKITEGGSYNASAYVQQFIVDANGNTIIRGSSGRNKYTIMPHPKVNVTILNFHKNEDLIDLSYFKGITDLNSLSYFTNPLTLLLTNKQTVVLPTHTNFDLSNSNFIFSKDSSGSSSSSSSSGLDPSVFTPDVIVSVTILGALLLLTMLLYKLKKNEEFMQWFLNSLKKKKKRVGVMPIPPDGHSKILPRPPGPPPPPNLPPKPTVQQYVRSTHIDHLPEMKIVEMMTRNSSSESDSLEFDIFHNGSDEEDEELLDSHDDSLGDDSESSGSDLLDSGDDSDGESADELERVDLSETLYQSEKLNRPPSRSDTAFFFEKIFPRFQESSPPSDRHTLTLKPPVATAPSDSEDSDIENQLCSPLSSEDGDDLPVVVVPAFPRFPHGQVEESQEQEALVRPRTMFAGSRVAPVSSPVREEGSSWANEVVSPSEDEGYEGKRKSSVVRFAEESKVVDHPRTSRRSALSSDYSPWKDEKIPDDDRSLQKLAGDEVESSRDTVRSVRRSAISAKSPKANDQNRRTAISLDPSAWQNEDEDDEEDNFDSSRTTIRAARRSAVSTKLSPSKDQYRRPAVSFALPTKIPGDDPELGDEMGEEQGLGYGSASRDTFRTTRRSAVSTSISQLEGKESLTGPGRHTRHAPLYSKSWSVEQSSVGSPAFPFLPLPAALYGYPTGFPSAVDASQQGVLPFVDKSWNVAPQYQPSEVDPSADSNV